MEVELANHVKNLDDRFHGLTPMKVRDLAYGFAKAKNITLPTSWTLNRTAGRSIILSNITIFCLAAGHCT